MMAVFMVGYILLILYWDNFILTFKIWYTFFYELFLYFEIYTVYKMIKNI